MTVSLLGRDGYTFLRVATNAVAGPSGLDAFIACLSANAPIMAPTDYRIATPP